MTINIEQVVAAKSEVFVAMLMTQENTSLTEELENMYELLIDPVLTDLDYTPYRVDRDFGAHNLAKTIIAGIEQVAVVLVDLTKDPDRGPSGNVLFEAGYAKGIGKPVVWLCREDVATRCTPFDLLPYSQVRWKSAGLAKRKDELREKLKIHVSVPV